MSDDSRDRRVRRDASWRDVLQTAIVCATFVAIVWIIAAALTR